MLNYSTQYYTKQISVSEYLNHYRDAERFGTYCKACPNYAKSWACPPFDFDVEQRLSQYHNLLLIVCKITPSDTALPITVSRELIRPERISLEKKLLDLEQQYNALSAAYVGSCLHCPEGTCTRANGLPYRHPKCVRPSLEGYGFDISRTTKELFGLDLLWGKDGHMPEYLLLVCGLFHNEKHIQL
jgi:predicted metal-binding protein